MLQAKINLPHESIKFACRPEKQVEAEQNNVKMAQKLLHRIHRFEGAPMPLEDTIHEAARRVTELEEQMKEEQMKKEDGERKKQLGNFKILDLSLTQHIIVN